VQSENDPTIRYRVNFEDETCECDDFVHRGETCKHLQGRNGEGYRVSQHFLGYKYPNILLIQEGISRISMLKTKTNEYHQIVVDHQNYDQLHTRYGANRSFNDVITEILKHHALAVKVISDCERCTTEFKEAVKLNS
jgi:hypothetical protein